MVSMFETRTGKFVFENRRAFCSAEVLYLWRTASVGAANARLAAVGRVPGGAGATRAIPVGNSIEG